MLGWQLDNRGLLHPSRELLIDFAESFIHRHPVLSASLAAHIAQCPKCSTEVELMLASLEITRLSEGPAPSKTLRHEILLRTSNRLSTKPKHSTSIGFFRVLQYAICFVLLTSLAVFSYYAFLQAITPYTPERASNANLMALFDQKDNVSELLRRAEIVSELTFPVSTNPEQATSKSVHELRQIEILKQDLNKAINALQRNPGSIRVSQVILVSLERHIKSLRDLYLTPSY